MTKAFATMTGLSLAIAALVPLANAASDTGVPDMEPRDMLEELREACSDTEDKRECAHTFFQENHPRKGFGYMMPEMTEEMRERMQELHEELKERCSDAEDKRECAKEFHEELVENGEELPPFGMMHRGRGRGMKAGHARMNLSEEDREAAKEDINACFDEHKGDREAMHACMESVKETYSAE